MGLPMARALTRARIDTVGHDIRDAPYDGIRMEFDPATFAQDRDVILTMVQGEAETETLFASLTPHLAPNSTVLLGTTLPPEFVRHIGRTLPLGVSCYDTPVLGDPVAAETARLTFVMGGHDGTPDEITLLLSAMGEHILNVGPLGAGMTMVLLNGFVAASSAASVRAALSAALAEDLDPRRLLDLLGGGLGQTHFGDSFDALAFSRAAYAEENAFGEMARDLKTVLPLLSKSGGQEVAQALEVAIRRFKSLNVPIDPN